MKITKTLNNLLRVFGVVTLGLTLAACDKDCGCNSSKNGTSKVQVGDILQVKLSKDKVVLLESNVWCKNLQAIGNAVRFANGAVACMLAFETVPAEIEMPVQPRSLSNIREETP